MHRRRREEIRSRRQELTQLDEHSSRFLESDANPASKLLGATRRDLTSAQADQLIVTGDISRDQAEVSLGGKAFEVLVSLVEAPEQAAVRSISELGDLLEATCDRLLAPKARGSAPVVELPAGRFVYFK